MGQVEYKLEAGRVAATLLAREGALEQDMFRLHSVGESYRLDTPWGEFPLTRQEIEVHEPDPLWQSAAGICSHMEEDHSDSFPVFLRTVGRSLDENERVKMPWVESSGFFLALECPQGTEHCWIPFPQVCQDPNQVRTTLIRMLRVGRREQ